MLNLLIILSPSVYVDIETDERAAVGISERPAIIKRSRERIEKS